MEGYRIKDQVWNKSLVAQLIEVNGWTLSYTTYAGIWTLPMIGITQGSAYGLVFLTELAAHCDTVL